MSTRNRRKPQPGVRRSFKRYRNLSDHISSFIVDHGFHILNMSQTEYVKVQKHCRNQSFLVTIPFRIAEEIPITKGDVMKTVLDGKRVIMEKV